PKTSKQSTIVDSRVRSTGLRVFGDGLEAPWVLPTAQVENFSACKVAESHIQMHRQKCLNAENYLAIKKLV
ncbi:MAG: hypothetical protein J6P05_05255, partial [Lachnospiraceae bacterium]|nr:hypothetical protein [Lachnospiraceae bacterium]